MFKKINDMVLQYHIRAMLKNYYFMLGLNMKDLENKTTEELIAIFEKVASQLKQQNELLTKTVEHQGKIIEGLKEDKERLEQYNNTLQERIDKVVERNTILSQRLQPQQIKENKKAAGLER